MKTSFVALFVLVATNGAWSQDQYQTNARPQQDVAGTNAYYTQQTFAQAPASMPYPMYRNPGVHVYQVPFSLPNNDLSLGYTGVQNPGSSVEKKEVLAQKPEVMYVNVNQQGSSQLKRLEESIIKLNAFMEHIAQAPAPRPEAETEAPVESVTEK